MKPPPSPLLSPPHPLHCLCRQKGKKPFKSLRNLKTDLDLNMEGDLNIIMALAEKLRAGLHSFVFGKPFYTSVQEREVLHTLWAATASSKCAHVYKWSQKKAAFAWMFFGFLGVFFCWFDCVRTGGTNFHLGLVTWQIGHCCWNERFLHVDLIHWKRH